MSQSVSPRDEYLEQLSDLLPPREITRVRADVESLILERVSGELDKHPDLDPIEAERRALSALGPVEKLADEVVSDPVLLTLSARRTFVRMLAVTFAGHLLLSIVLTVAGAEEAAIPGLLGPLPVGPFTRVLLAIVTVFLIDAGVMLCLFVALGKMRPERTMPQLYIRARWTRKGAIEGLVLLALLAVILNFLLDSVFSVKHGDELRPFLSEDVMALVPLVNVVLALFALRHILTLIRDGESTLALVADVLGSLAGVVMLILGATRRELVHMPNEKLGPDAAIVLDNLIERVFLLVFVLGALLLTARFVRESIRLWRRLRA